MNNPETHKEPQAVREGNCSRAASPSIQTGADSNVYVPSVDWSVDISRYVGMLEGILHTSEEGFLSVGSKLMEIHAGAQEISKKLALLMNEYSAEKGTDSLDELRSISDKSRKQLNSFNKYSLETTTTLQALESPLDALPESMREFDRLVSRLRKMGLVAHIEAARVGDDGLDFVRLAENVSLLGEQIAAKAKEVRSYVRDVDRVVAANTAEMGEMISKHTIVAENIDGDMQNNLRVLEERQKMYRQAASAIALGSDEAINQINMVVQSVQYHDITRQQVEHIVEALHAVVKHDSIVEIVPVCELQVAQLRRVAREFEVAVMVIINALKKLSGALTTMISESERMASFTKDSGNTFFEHVERAFQTVSTTMIDDRNTIKGFTASLHDIRENIKEMKLFMDEMADVGLEIELLALNSRIKAAKIGDGGEALGVIAESIQHLSSDTLEQVERVIGQMSHMVSVAEELAAADVIDKVVGRAEAETGNIMDRLAVVVGFFHSNNTVSTEVFLETEQMCEEIVGQLDSLTEKIRRNGELASAMISTGDMLEQVKEQLRKSVPESVQVKVDERLEEIRDAYTMESERLTHGSVLRGDPGENAESSAGGDIELF